MDTEILCPATPADFERAAALIRSGALVAFPTETVRTVSMPPHARASTRRRAVRPTIRSFSMLLILRWYMTLHERFRKPLHIC